MPSTPTTTPEKTDQSSKLSPAVRTAAHLKKGPGRAWMSRFLLKLEALGSISAAASAAGVGRRTVYDERARNPEFDQAVVEATAACVEAVEATLYQRALSGASDTAIIFYLKTRKPEIYGDRLTAQKIEAIREQARREVIAEMQAELRKLPPQAREVLRAAVPPA